MAKEEGARRGSGISMADLLSAKFGFPGMSDHSELGREYAGRGGKDDIMSDLFKSFLMAKMLHGAGPDKCGDKNCPICGGDGKDRPISGSPKDKHHIIGDAKLKGARSEAEHLEEAVSLLTEVRDELIGKLEAAKKEIKTKSQRIGDLELAVDDLGRSKGRLHERNNHLATKVEEQGEQISQLVKTVEQQEQAVEKVRAVITAATAKKLTKTDLLILFHEAEKVLSPAPAQA